VLAERAVALLRNLPPAARERLDDAGDVIERLQSRIRRLREREDELDTALSQAGDPRAALSRDVAGAGRTLVERRIELTKELEQARREVAGRRASASAALENIRLQLLRLHAGVGAPSDLTADLETARAIERQISAAIEVNTVVSPAATLPELSESGPRSHDSSLTSGNSGTPPLRA
jgi:chromosome segregation ATPase